MTSYVYVGNHSQSLAKGGQLTQGDRCTDEDLTDEETYLIEDGKLRDLESFDPTPDGEQPPLAGAALKDRARDLGVEGHSTLSADELRAAIAAIESESED